MHARLLILPLVWSATRTPQRRFPVTMHAQPHIVQLAMDPHPKPKLENKKPNLPDRQETSIKTLRRSRCSKIMDKSEAKKKKTERHWEEMEHSGSGAFTELSWEA